MDIFPLTGRHDEIVCVRKWAHPVGACIFSTANNRTMVGGDSCLVMPCYSSRCRACIYYSVRDQPVNGNRIAVAIGAADAQLFTLPYKVIDTQRASLAASCCQGMSQFIRLHSSFYFTPNRYAHSIRCALLLQI